MKIDRRVNDRFRLYASKLGQSYTVCLERILTEYLDDKKVPYDTHDSSKPMTGVKDR